MSNIAVSLIVLLSVFTGGCVWWLGNQLDAAKHELDRQRKSTRRQAEQAYADGFVDAFMLGVETGLATAKDCIRQDIPLPDRNEQPSWLREAALKKYGERNAGQ